MAIIRIPVHVGRFTAMALYLETRNFGFNYAREQDSRLIQTTHEPREHLGRSNYQPSVASTPTKLFPLLPPKLIHRYLLFIKAGGN